MPWRPLGLREVEAPICSDIRLTDGGMVVSPTQRPLFTYQEHSWHSILSEAEVGLGKGKGKVIPVLN
jgi:hypothetical protein